MNIFIIETLKHLKVKCKCSKTLYNACGTRYPCYPDFALYDSKDAENHN